MRDIAEFFHRPDEGRYGIAIYTDNSYDALVMGYENALFSYGGDLGDYSTYEVDGIVNSDKAVAALEMYRELYQFTPPNWGKTFFQEDNQAITEGLAAMSMNYFAFFPALANPAINPHAEVTGYFANPAGPDGDAARGARRPGHLDRQLLAEPGGGVQVPRVVHPGGRAEAAGPSSAATPRTPRSLESEEFRNATPYNEAFYQSMFMVKDFWAVPEYAELLTQINNRIYPFVVGGEGTAKEALDGLAAGLGGDLQEVRPHVGRGPGRTPRRPAPSERRRQDTGASRVLARLDPRSRAAARGWSDIAIRNLFIIPTIVFLIVFNIFPLIYSLGYSFTDFRASVNEPVNFVGLRNYRELLADPNIWRNFTVTAKYVIVSVTGQVVVGFGLAMLLNRSFPLKGLVTTLLLLPMMMSMAVVGLFWKLLYDPSWGPLNYALGLGNVRLAVEPATARSTPSRSPTSGCGRRS